MLVLTRREGEEIVIGTGTGQVPRPPYVVERLVDRYDTLERENHDLRKAPEPTGDFSHVRALHPHDWAKSSKTAGDCAVYRVRFRWYMMPWRGKRRKVLAVRPVKVKGRWYWRVTLKDRSDR